MVKSPHISAVLEEKHPGYVVISIDGKVVGLGKNSIEALKKAKLEFPDIDDRPFLISRIHGKILVA